MKKYYITPLIFEEAIRMSKCIMIPESLPVGDDEVEIVGSKSREDFDEDEIEFIKMMENNTDKNGLW